MARYITLINFTEQGIKTIKDWDKRIAATRLSQSLIVLMPCSVKLMRVM